eukprot:4785579-Pleurochrysis_carterae.AAC.3
MTAQGSHAIVTQGTVGTASAMAEGKLVLAVDNGSGFIKCGVAGDEQPRVVQPTHGLAEADGRAPLCNGIVSDWDAMETYWDHIWTNGMQVDTERCAVVITAHLFETKDNKVCM